jgi:hypothetical protein
MREITQLLEGRPRHFDRSLRVRIGYPPARRVLVATGLCAVIAIHVAAGVRGVGFGQMWDEGEQLSTVQRSVSSLTFAPASYYYGGLYQLPGFLAIAPTFVAHLPEIMGELKAAPSQPFEAKNYPSIRAAQAEARADIDRPEFRNLDRRIFVCLVSLIVVWVFIASHRVSGSPWAALAAAAATGLSWELSYHGRWIAADALQAQFGALTFALIVVALDAKTPALRRRWFRLAAVATGLAVSCKVLGVFLLFPIVIAIWASTDERRFPRAIVLSLEACAIAFAVFAATTPGLLLEPIHYLNDVLKVARVYATQFSDDYPLTEPRVGLRIAKIVSYLSIVLLSPYGAAAVALVLLAVVGAVVGLLQRRAKVIALLAFGLAYFAFVARQRVFVARNVLILLPVLAILMSAGLSHGVALVRRWRFGPSTVGLALAIVFAANARWIWHAAATVGTMTNAKIGRDVIDYVAARPAKKFYISPTVMNLLKVHHEPDVAALHIQSAPWAEAEYVVIEGGRGSAGKTNVAKSGTYFASLHANFDYYPSLMTFLDLASYGTPIMILRKDLAADRGVVDGQ